MDWSEARRVDQDIRKQKEQLDAYERVQNERQQQRRQQSWEVLKVYVEQYGKAAEAQKIKAQIVWSDDSVQIDGVKLSWKPGGYLFEVQPLVDGRDGRKHSYEMEVRGQKLVLLDRTIAFKADDKGVQRAIEEASTWFDLDQPTFDRVLNSLRFRQRVRVVPAPKASVSAEAVVLVLVLVAIAGLVVASLAAG